MVPPSSPSSNNGDALVKRATGVLEIITGQAPTKVKVDPRVVDPQTAGMSEGQFQAEDKVVAGAIMERMKKVKRTGNNSNIKGKKQASALTKQKLNVVKKKEKEFARVQDTEFKAAKAATQIKVDLHGPKMWYLMDKLREFYLPDVSHSQNDPTTLRTPPGLAKIGRGHDLNMERKHIAGRFGVWVRGFPSIPLRPISQDENPVTAFTTYSIPCLDLMKFPDIEAHYEQLGSLDSLHLTIRPTLQVTTPVPKYMQKAPFFVRHRQNIIDAMVIGTNVQSIHA